MKNLLFKIFILSLFSSIFPSCALHTGYMQGSAVLSSNNFTYVKRDVQGTAKATYVFGIGGLKRMTLVNDAKKNLLENYQLQNNQALVDITVNWKRTSILPFLVFNRCTVTASVVEFK